MLKYIDVIFHPSSRMSPHSDGNPWASGGRCPTCGQSCLGAPKAFLRGSLAERMDCQVLLPGSLGPRRISCVSFFVLVPATRRGQQA